MSAKNSLKMSKFVKIGVGAGTAFVVSQFAFGSERFYNEIVSLTIFFDLNNSPLSSCLLFIALPMQKRHMDTLLKWLLTD